MKFGINFTSCGGNSNFAVIATTSGIYPKISLLPGLSKINTTASFVKVNTVETRCKVENRLTLLCIGRRLTHFLAE